MHAECAIYTAMLQICRRPCVLLYSRKSFEMAPAACVQNFRGETWDGSGDVLRVYFRKGRYRWMKSNWKNMLEGS